VLSRLNPGKGPLGDGGVWLMTLDLLRQKGASPQVSKGKSFSRVKRNSQGPRGQKGARLSNELFCVATYVFNANGTKILSPKPVPFQYHVLSSHRRRTIYLGSLTLPRQTDGD